MVVFHISADGHQMTLRKEEDDILLIIVFVCLFIFLGNHLYLEVKLESLLRYYFFHILNTALVPNFSLFSGKHWEIIRFYSQ